jgi:hypothetical protein
VFVIVYEKSFATLVTGPICERSRLYVSGEDWIWKLAETAGSPT